MKRIVFLIVFAFFSFLNIQSQNFFIQKSAFGIEGGYVMGEFTTESSEDDKIRSNNGIYGGLNSQFFIDQNIFIRPSIIFSYAQETIWLHLPVFLKYYITDHVSLLAGPQGSIIVGMKTPYHTSGIDFAAGAAFDITDNFYIEARYNFELTNSRLKDSEPSGNSRYNSIFAGIGYKFL